jgi:hypothetical protein
MGNQALLGTGESPPWKRRLRSLERPDPRPPTSRFSMWGDVTPNPFVLGHRLVRDGINGVSVLRALVEHSEVTVGAPSAGCLRDPRLA